MLTCVPGVLVSTRPVSRSGSLQCWVLVRVAALGSCGARLSMVEDRHMQALTACWLHHCFSLSTTTVTIIASTCLLVCLGRDRGWSTSTTTTPAVIAMLRVETVAGSVRRSGGVTLLVAALSPARAWAKLVPRHGFGFAENRSLCYRCQRIIFVEGSRCVSTSRPGTTKLWASGPSQMTPLERVAC